MKIQTTDYQKLSANQISDKGPTSQTYKKTFRNTTVRNNPIKKQATDLKRHFSK